MGQRFVLVLKSLSVILLFLIAFEVKSSVDVPEKETIRIGLLTTRDPNFFIDTFGPTIADLRRKFRNTRFVTQELSLDSLISDIKQNQLDFVIVPSGVYAFLERTYGAKLVASRARKEAQDCNYSTGAAIIARKTDKKISSLGDLKGAKIAASSPDNFDDWQIPLGELRKINITEEELRKHTTFTNFEIPDVATLVATGHADVGFLPVCELEQLIAMGFFSPDTFKVINKKNSDGLSCAHSTDLFPGIVFAALPAAKSTDVKKLTMALLSMSSKESNNNAWEIANKFEGVTKLYESLGIKPFVRDLSWKEFFLKNAYYFAVLLLCIFFLIVHVLRTEALVKKKTAQLSDALAKKMELEKQSKEAQEKLLQLERGGVVSQMSAMFAHEVRQPVETLLNYAEGLRYYLTTLGKEDKIVGEAIDAISIEAKRVSQIVGRVRSYVRTNKRTRQPCCISEIINSALKTFSHSPKSINVRFSLEVPSDLVVEGDPLELELVFINLFRNASDAMKDQQEKRIVVTAEKRGADKVTCTVEDFGPKLTAEELDNLNHPMKTTKKDGLGLGLGLCNHIVLAHGGHLDFEPKEKCGLRAEIVLPLVSEKEVSC